MAESNSEASFKEVIEKRWDALDRNWGARLQKSLDEPLPPKANFTEAALATGFTEAEKRISEIRSLILNSIAFTEQSDPAKITEAAIVVVRELSTSVYESVQNHVYDFVLSDTLGDQGVKHVVSDFEKERERALIWMDDETRLRAEKQLTKRQILLATLASAKAARKTALWTMWVVIITGLSVLVAVGSTLYTLWKPDHKSAVQMIDQRVTNLDDRGDFAEKCVGGETGQSLCVELARAGLPRDRHQVAHVTGNPTHTGQGQ